MLKIENGGPAFPSVPVSSETPEKYSGMSLRDWFAGQALAGYVAAQSDDLEPGYYATIAYEIADAMLLARTAVPAKAEGER